MEKKEKQSTTPSIVEAEMKKLALTEAEENREEQIHSEKMRFKHADKIYE